MSAVVRSLLNSSVPDGGATRTIVATWRGPLCFGSKRTILAPRKSGENPLFVVEKPPGADTRSWFQLLLSRRASTHSERPMRSSVGSLESRLRKSPSR